MPHTARTRLGKIWPPAAGTFHASSTSDWRWLHPQAQSRAESASEIRYVDTRHHAELRVGPERTRTEPPLCVALSGGRAAAERLRMGCLVRRSQPGFGVDVRMGSVKLPPARRGLLQWAMLRRGGDMLRFAWSVRLLSRGSVH